MPTTEEAVPETAVPTKPLEGLDVLDEEVESVVVVEVDVLVRLNLLEMLAATLASAEDRLATALERLAAAEPVAVAASEDRLSSWDSADADALAMMLESWEPVGRWGSAEQRAARPKLRMKEVARIFADVV